MKDKAILCVDDEAIILLSLKRELQQQFGENYLIETALNATEATELIEDLTLEGIRILLIISDWLMPGIRGDEFLIAIHAKYPHIKAIMITGQADDSAIKRVKAEANIHQVFTKPWNRVALFDSIRECLP